MAYEDLVAKSTALVTIKLLPLIEKAALSVEPVPDTKLKVRVSPASGSTALMVATVVPPVCTVGNGARAQLRSGWRFVYVGYGNRQNFFELSPPASAVRTRIE